MTNKIELKTKFIVPDDMGEENIRHIVGQFFADLVRTDRFVDARIVDHSEISDAEKDRLIEMLEEVNMDDLDRLGSAIEEYTE